MPVLSTPVRLELASSTNLSATVALARLEEKEPTVEKVSPGLVFVECHSFHAHVALVTQMNKRYFFSL